MRDIDPKKIGGVLVGIVMMALAVGAATAAGDAVSVNGFGEQLHQLHEFDSSPNTTAAAPYCNAERLTEQLRLLRNRKAVLINDIQQKKAELLGRQMSAAERAKRQSDLQRFIDGLVDVLGVKFAGSPPDPLEAEFVALVRELARVERQLAAVMQRVQKCKSEEEASGGNKLQILRPF